MKEKVKKKQLNGKHRKKIKIIKKKNGRKSKKKKVTKKKRMRCSCKSEN